MITVLPMDKNEALKFIEESSINIDTKNENITVLLAKDEDVILGYIAMQKDDIYLNILDIIIENSSTVRTGELLLKSAASYALNRNLFTLKSDNENIFGLFLQNKGKQISGVMYINIHELLSCNSCQTQTEV